MNIDFNKYPDRLVPAIIQDKVTDKVLMLGYMNEEAVNETQSSGKVVFYSRSKQRLWMKGETSGNYLNVSDILQDCDNDCLLIKACPEGRVCHTAAATCFGEPNKNNDFPPILEGIIADRKAYPGSSSCASSLFEKG